MVHTAVQHSLAVDKEKKTHITHSAKKLKFRAEIFIFTPTDLARVRSLDALHTHALRPGSGVALLGHSLAMSTERTHALTSRLVHSHWRPTHIGRTHGCAHVPRKGWRAAGSWLVHELAVVRLVWCHLERGAHLEDKINQL